MFPTSLYKCNNKYISSSEERQLGNVILCIFVGVSFLYIYASFSLLAYYADSAHYLFQVITRSTFYLVEPSSRTVQIMQQAPVLIFRYLGVSNIYFLSVVFGMTLLFLPFFQVLICYLILPVEKRIFIIFPLLHFLIGTLASFFPVVTDAPIAAGYFWVLFYLIMFRSGSVRMMLLICILSIPSAYLHESMAFLAPILAFAALLQLRGRGKLGKTYYVLLSFWFVLVTIIDLNYIIYPRAMDNRSGFLRQLIDLRWVYWNGFNTTTISAILFFCCLGGLSVLGIKGDADVNRRAKGVIIWLFALSCFAMLIFTVVDAGFYGVVTQFAARANSTLVSFPLSLLVLVTIWKPALILFWINRNIFTLVALFAAGVLLMHAVGIYQWSRYIRTFDSLVNNRVGIVSQIELKNLLSKQSYLNFKKMSWSWTLPTISFLLSDNREVKSIVLSPKGGWQPFDPCNIRSLPKTDLFDIQPIVTYLNEKGCVSEGEKR
ncbi:MAG: hypothetical protein K9K37_01200 [Desulfocapsa sp.]|nr:hypothetical protein [Desulfocapsa sp.]